MVLSALNRKYNEEHGVRRGGTYALAVVPSDRKKGLGTALTLKSLEWIRNRGMDVAYVSVNIANPDAFNIYRILGYQTVQVYQGYRINIQ
jgi:ribosomal protein S18 acetylase RimI-like enzyme